MRLVLSLFLSGLCVLACAKQQVGDRGLKPRSLLDPIVGDHSFEKAFDNNTQTKSAHTELLPALKARVTFWNDDVRKAFIREKAGRLRLTDDEEALLAKEELSESEAYAVFILNIGTREMEWNNFEEKRSIWRLSLEDPSSKTKIYPERIEPISAKDEQSRYFYQGEESYMKLYKVRFPRESVKNLDEMVLHISGIHGALQFAFQNDSKGSTP